MAHRIDPFAVVRDFERALCDYTGAKYAVATTSCTTALLFACAWCKSHREWLAMEADMLAYIMGEKFSLVIPRRTYIGVPQSILHAGFSVEFEDVSWSGGYQLNPIPVWDYARRFTSGMYRAGQMQCVSFHWGKILGIGQGGAILHDNPEADGWLRRARFDGRSEFVSASEDIPSHLGYHAYMMPRDAAEGLTRLAYLPEHNEDLPNSDYPDLSKIPLFQ